MFDYYTRENIQIVDDDGVKIQDYDFNFANVLSYFYTGKYLIIYGIVSYDGELMPFEDALIGNMRGVDSGIKTFRFERIR